MAQKARIATHIALAAIALVISGTVLAGAALADDFKGYWQRGAVVDWSTPPRANSSSDITIESHTAEYQRKKLAEEMKKAALQAPQQQVSQQQAHGQPGIQQPAPAEARPSPEQPLSRDQIFEKFGRPDESRFVLAQKDAPPEFQAMLLALNQGDKELAFEYARAYTRRMDKMADLVSTAAQYQGIAKEVEGFATEPTQAANGQLDGVRAELLPYIERAKAERRKQAVDLEKTLASAEGIDAPDADTAQVAAHRTNFADVPVDPAGRVKLLVFFNEGDATANLQLAETLRVLKERVPTTTDFQVLGLTRKTYTKEALKRIGADTSFPFPLLNGEALSQQVRILKYPTFLFMALTSKQLYRMEGVQSPDDIEKVIRLMRGGR
jgi:hypothetical protein